jgi:hypothetical protein
MNYELARGQDGASPEKIEEGVCLGIERSDLFPRMDDLDREAITTQELL